MAATETSDQKIDRLLAKVDALTARVAGLERENQTLHAENAKLRTKLAKVEAENTDLRGRLGMNSSNSSMPPSTDAPCVVRGKKEPTGRKRGGQPGHEAQLREPIPDDQITGRHELHPTHCDGCHRELTGAAVEPRHHQVVDLPDFRPLVDDWALHGRGCEHCGTVTRARLPADVPVGNFGPGVIALVALLTAHVGASKRKAQGFLAQLLNVKVALGTICALERLAADATEPAYEEARAAVLASPEAGADETGWRVAKTKGWLWVAVCATAAYFVVARSRGAAVAKHLLEGFEGILSTDRWVGYNWVPLERRQLCWAHLSRDIQSWVDRGGIGELLGGALKREKDKLFRWWSEVRDGTMTRAQFRKRVQRDVQPAVRRLLEMAVVCPDPKIAGMAKELLKVETALWTFVRIAGIQPTNHRSERTIRPAVMWRKRSFGNDSLEGARFVAHMLTVEATLRQMNRGMYAFLLNSVRAHVRHTTPPSIFAAAPGGEMARAA